MLSNRSLIASAAIQMAGVAATFATSVVISRTMGASGQGHWATIRSVVDLAAVVLSFGLPTAFPFFLNAGQVAGAAVARFCMLWSGLSFPLAVVGMLAVQALGALALDLPGQQTALLLAAASALLTAHALWRGLCLAGTSTAIFNTVTVALPVAQLLVIVLLRPTGTLDLLHSATAGPLAAVALSALLWQRFRMADKPNAPHRVPYQEFARFGGWNLVVGVIAAAQPASAIALLNHAGASKSMVGLFSIALLAMGAMLMPVNLLGPMIYNAWTRSDAPDQVRAHYRKLFRAGLALAGASTVVAMALAPMAIDLVFGKAFSAAAEPTRILLLAVPIGYGFRLMVNILMSRGQLAAYALVTLTRLLTMVVMMLVQADLSIVATAWAWLAGELVAFVLTAALVRGTDGWRLSDVLGLARS